MEIGCLIRQAREERNLTQAVLAARAGLSAAQISSLETGRRRPYLDTVARVLAVMGLQLHTELEPLWADVDAEIDAARDQSLEDRMRRWTVSLIPLVERLGRGRVPFAIGGVAAAALQGAPVPVECVDVIVPRRDEVLRDLTHVLIMDLIASRRSPRWPYWGGLHPDPREPGELRYTSSLTGEFRLELVDRLTPDLQVEVGALRVPVVALARLDVGGGWTGRVLSRMRSRAGSGAGARDGGVRCQDAPVCGTVAPGNRDTPMCETIASGNRDAERSVPEPGCAGMGNGRASGKGDVVEFIDQ